MLQNLFSMLKTEWGRLSKNTKDWISHLERKDSTGSDAEYIAARESLSNKNSFVSAADEQMQRVKSDTDADVRDAATKVQSYLENTESLHQQLTQLSIDDAEANRHAQAVQEARKAVTEQIDAIRQATSVHVMSSALPGVAPLPENVSTVGTTVGSTPTAGTSPSGSGTGLTSNLFLDTMTCLVGKVVKGLPPIEQDDVLSTQKLFFEERSFELTNDQLDHLTQSWSTVVVVFFDPSKFPADGTTECSTLFAKITTTDRLQEEAHLFTIHDHLEKLYDELAARVIHPTEIVTTNI